MVDIKLLIILIVLLIMTIFATLYFNISSSEENIVEDKPISSIEDRKKALKGMFN